MTYRVHTSSGAVHEVDLGARTIRRLHAHPETGEYHYDELRGDGQALRLLLEPQPPVVGRPWTFVLEPLAEGADMTVRTTTPVVRVEQLD